MKCRVLKVDPQRPEESVLREAAEVLRGGGLVAYPTDTLYGLGANAFDGKAVKKVFEAKRRSRDSPLPVLVSSMSQVKAISSEVNDETKTLISRFWPGPLTVIVKASKELPHEVTACTGKVGVRMPDNRVALSLITSLGLPVTGASANISGKVSPISAEDVISELGDEIDVVIDGGSDLLGIESTVVDATGPEPLIVREGAVLKEDLEEALGRPVKLAERRKKIKLPVKRFVVVKNAPEEVCKFLKDRIIASVREGQRVAVLAPEDEIPSIRDALGAEVPVISLGPKSDLRRAARYLYPALREVEENYPDFVCALLMPNSGLGRVINKKLLSLATEVLG